MKAKAITLLCILFLLVSCASHKHHYSHSLLSKNQASLIDKAIDDIAQKNTLPRLAIHNGGIYDITEGELFYRMLAVEDLDSLARHHPSPAVRATLGVILIERAPRAAKRLLAERISDTSTLLTTSYGFCIVTRSGNTVGNVMFSYALDRHLFSREELVTLDSLILATPACRHLNRYHQLTGTPIPREAFHSSMPHYYWRSPAFHPNLLTDQRLLSDTTLFYSQIVGRLQLEGHPMCYILDSYMRDSWKGHTLVQVYIADGHPDRLALLLIDGKYDIVDTMTVTEPYQIHPLSETDTLRIRTYFKANPKPLMRTEELTLRHIPGQPVDTLAEQHINRIYTVTDEGRFVFSNEQHIQYDKH